MSAFASVAEAVAEFAISPGLSLLTALFSSLTNLICEGLSILASAAAGMFHMDIGTGASLFERVLGGFPMWMPLMQVMAMTLLCLFLITAIMKMIASPNSNETPQSVVGMTFVAGGAIYLGPYFVVWVENGLCSPVYDFLLTWGNTTHVDALNIAGAVNDFMIEDARFFEPTQGDTLLASFVLFFLFMMIATKFISYVFEIGQRYVVLGVLITTSPLAFSFLVSKSTRPSFSKWMKMVFSEMFLMLTNVIFVSLFLKGMTSFSNYVENYDASAGSSRMTYVLLWGLLLYAIIYVGEKLDSYLNTLGISTAETGSDLLTAMVSDFLDIGMIGQQAFRPLRFSGMREAEDHPEPKSPLERLVSAAKLATGDYRAERTSAADTLVFRKTGSGQSVPTVDSINRAVKNITASDKSLTRAGGLSFEQSKGIGAAALSNARGIPQKYKDKLYGGNCSIQNNSIVMEGPITKNGAPELGIILVPKEFFPEGDMPLGRDVSIGDTDYRAIAYGNTAQSFNTYNPAAMRDLEKQYGDTVPIVGIRNTDSETGRSSPAGVYQMTQVSPDRQSVTFHQWAPTSAYHRPQDRYCTTERLGSLDYHHAQVTLPVSDTGELLRECDGYAQVPERAADRAYWLQENFPSAAAQGFTFDGLYGEKSLPVLSRSGERFALASQARFYTTNAADAEGVLQITAANGVPYSMVRLDGDIDTLPISEAPGFTGSSENGERCVMFDEQSASAQMPAFRASIPDILRQAKDIRTQKRHSEGRDRTNGS